jgi:hypothetical protein
MTLSEIKGLEMWALSGRDREQRQKIVCDSSCNT